MTTEQVITPTIPVSGSLRAVMGYAKTQSPTFTWKALANVLSAQYGFNLNFIDVVTILFDLYTEVLKEPRFEVGRRHGALADLALAPVKGFDSLRFPGMAQLGDTYTIDQFYESLIRHVMGNFRLARVDWLNTPEGFWKPEKAYANT